MNSLPNLHDSTFKKLAFDWATATLHLLFQVGVESSDVVVLEAQSVTDLRFPRLLPWGPSNSVNSATVEGVGEGQLLSIEMQSGDVLLVSCRSVATIKAPASEALVASV
jgi:hypothetical protein